MLTFIVIAAIWYLVGLVLVVISATDGTDLHVVDLPLVLACAIWGPLLLLFMWLSTSGKGQIVVMKGRERTKPVEK